MASEIVDHPNNTTAKEKWDDVRLWALAETLSARMDALREQGRKVSNDQASRAIGAGESVIPFRPRR